MGVERIYPLDSNVWFLLWDASHPSQLPRSFCRTLPNQKTPTWMSQEVDGSMVSKRVTTSLVNGVYWGYIPLTLIFDPNFQRDILVNEVRNLLFQESIFRFHVKSGWWNHMDVSENSGTPKSSILIGCSITNHPFWGTPIFGNTHVPTTHVCFQLPQTFLLCFYLSRTEDSLGAVGWWEFKSELDQNSSYQVSNEKGPLAV